MEATSGNRNLSDFEPRFHSRRKIPMVLQMERNECGLACLVMVAAGFGIEVDLRSLRHRTARGHASTNIRQLVRLAHSLGLNGRALQVELDEVKSLHVPAILHWDLDHFVVLQKLKQRSFVIHDPAVGVRTYGYDELSLHFTGIALTFNLAVPIRPKSQRTQLSLRDLLGGFRRHSAQLLQIFFLSLIVHALALLSPIYLQLVIDQGITKGDMDLVILVAFLFAAVAVTKALVSYVRAIAVMQFSNRLGFELVGNAFRHLFTLPIQFFERREMGDMVSRFGALDNIKQLVSQDMITVILDGLFSVITLALLYLYSPLLATITAVSLVLVSLLRLLTVDVEMNKRNASLVAGARQQSVFMENIRSIAVTKSYNLRDVRLPDWENTFCKSINAGFHLGLFQLRIGSIQNLMYALENVLVICFGATLIQTGQLSLGQLLGFIFLKQHFANAIMAMFPKLAELRLMRLELDRVADILLSESEDPVTAGSLLQPEITGNIELKQLQFTYDSNEQPLFPRISCKISVGEQLVICGPSGSGKSTLVKIMAGMERGYGGEILIGGKPLSDYGAEHYREKVSLVHHGDKLIVGDLAFNIHLDTDPFNVERLRRACECAQVLKTIERLPQGFATKVGEIGEFLSSGEIQRVLIARALYRQPQIVFLDETLSHLSDEIAFRIINNIKEKGITLVLVTHNMKLRNCADHALHL